MACDAFVVILLWKCPCLIVSSVSSRIGFCCVVFSTILKFLKKALAQITDYMRSTGNDDVSLSG